MALKLKYQGQEASKNKDEYTFKQTYIGTKQEVASYIASLPAIGTKLEKGYLRRWTQTQEEGIFWNAEIEYGISFDSSGFSDSQEDTVTGKKSATLQTRNIQMPLQAHPNYLTCWNYYLISVLTTIPSWADSATDILIPVADRRHYQWVKSVGEIPLDPDPQGRYWVVLTKPLKAGVEYYDMACFCITITQKHNSATAAGNAIEKSINTIKSPSTTFGLGGQWKHDDSTVSYDGHHWISQNVYTRAVDEWDKDLYG